jgi:hypothetical protein
MLKAVREQWNRKTFSELDTPSQKKLKNSILRASVFEQVDPDDSSSIYEIFKRLNTGGMFLRDQEIRNCLYHGPINVFLEKLNSYGPWRSLLGNKEPDKRMRDIEMILRFFALSADWQKYSKPMKEFISRFMDSKKSLDEREQEMYRQKFESTMEVIQSRIGENAFRLTAGINLALFDSISVAVNQIGAENITELKKKYERLKSDPDFLDYTSQHTTDVESVKKRIKLAMEYLK